MKVKTRKGNLPGIGVIRTFSIDIGRSHSPNPTKSPLDIFNPGRTEYLVGSPVVGVRIRYIKNYGL